MSAPHGTPAHSASRRQFLRHARAAGLLGVAAPLSLSLAALGEAAAATANDYKALVCVFLYGGNDGANSIVAYDADRHARYRSLRGALALDRALLTPSVLGGPNAVMADGAEFALAPALAPLLPQWTRGQMGVLLNIGSLMETTTKADYLARRVALPPKLFSHNDQQSFWQSSAAEGSTAGWGGRLGELFADAQGRSLFTAVSVAGQAVYLAGRESAGLQVTPGGSVPINAVTRPLFGSRVAADALRSLITAPNPHHLIDAHTRTVTRSIAADQQLTAALGAAPSGFASDNPLAAQLAMVARMIAARDRLGVRRQVFFVSMGGFDTHADQLADHPLLLARVADALQAFQATLDADPQLARAVTTFTASDFGRSLTSNGDGSDHGWGSHHLLLGGAVRGGRFFGRAPELADNGPDDVGQGRFLPGLAVDQMAASLGRWFGVSETELRDVLPRLGGFPAADLGLLQA